MKDEYFSNYGTLKWLEPKDYYAGPWSYVCSDETIDGEYVDLVRHIETTEMRYTVV